MIDRPLTTGTFRRTIRIMVVGWVLLIGLAAAQWPGPAAAQDATKVRPSLPPPEALAIMIKTTLIAYNQGNLTGNYSVFHDLAAPVFRNNYSQARLADTFKEMRQSGIDISPIVLLQPKMIKPPEVDKDGDLVLDGYFDSRPKAIRFLLVFRSIRGNWRLFAINVKAVNPPQDAPPPEKLTEPQVVVDQSAAAEFAAERPAESAGWLPTAIKKYGWEIYAGIVVLLLLAFSSAVWSSRRQRHRRAADERRWERDDAFPFDAEPEGQPPWAAPRPAPREDFLRGPRNMRGRGAGTNGDGV